MTLKPIQCRAGRALLGWSQDDLEARSGVSKKTIADFEREAQIPYDRTLRDLELALEAGGAQLIPENGGGAGVRLKAAIPQLTRKRVSRFDRVANIAIQYRNRDYQLRLSTNILDDIDRTNHESESAFERSMDAHMNLILLTAAAAIDAGRAAESGSIELASDDFEETGPCRKTAEKSFSLEQRYTSKQPPHKTARIAQIADNGRKAWVELRNQDGALIKGQWAEYTQFIENWTLN